ncbi:hypothetical protein LOK49_LG15G01457 [Camellia lanceoleosa]|uniref:Uncharacterized protein n=1 Tax=Camellia lanceoleosa TaxID=1840588 RepID=A0ACC0F3B5_9ERIC|nr:hypothetical protein LOK49_LG15G01457 [Camellia lanceoleosa]
MWRLWLDQGIAYAEIKTLREGRKHRGTCMEKGAKIPANKEVKLRCCSSLYCVPHISKEMGFHWRCSLWNNLS